MKNCKSTINKLSKALNNKDKILQAKELESIAREDGFRSWKELELVLSEFKEQQHNQNNTQSCIVQYVNFLILDLKVKANQDELNKVGEVFLEIGIFNSAKYIFTLLVDLDHPGAQCRLGEMYLKSIGCAKDYTLAFNYLYKSANQGNPVAQDELGTMYMRGQGCSVDHKKAFDCFHKSAQQGYAGAQSNLGCMYHTGEGVNQCYHEAVKWYNASIENGLVIGMYNLSLIYNCNDESIRNREKHVKYLTMAAEHGYVEAQYNIGMLHYNEGRCNLGLNWIKKASLNGHRQARKIMSKYFDDYSYYDTL